MKTKTIILLGMLGGLALASLGATIVIGLTLRLFQVQIPFYLLFIIFALLNLGAIFISKEKWSTFKTLWYGVK